MDGAGCVRIQHAGLIYVEDEMLRPRWETWKRLHRTRWRTTQRWGFPLYFRRGRHTACCLETLQYSPIVYTCTWNTRLDRKMEAEIAPGLLSPVLGYQSDICTLARGLRYRHVEESLRSASRGAITNVKICEPWSNDESSLPEAMTTA